MSIDESPFDLRDTVAGTGLFAKRNWRRGDVICALSWQSTHSEPSKWTVQFTRTEHGMPSPGELLYVNHACDPTIQFDVDAMVIRAVKDVKVGDELTFFYPSTEWSMQSRFDCHCGSPRCIGQIVGAECMPASLLRQYCVSKTIESLLAQRELESATSDAA